MIWAAALVWMAGAAGQSPPTPEKFFEEFSARRDAMETLKARFVQTTITPDETIVSQGSLIYARPKRLIFRYQDPQLVYMIDGLRVYEFDPDIEQIQIYELEDRPESEAYYLGFETNSARLLEAYDVRVVPSDDPDRHALGVEFIPKPKEDEEPYFKSVLIQLRKGDLLPSTILIVNDTESSTSFLITDYDLNADLPEAATHLTVPEGTTMVDGGEYVGEAPAEGAVFPATTASAPQGLVESEELP